MLFIFSNNNTQNGQNLGPIENMAPLGPFTIHHQIIVIPNHTTKPKDIIPDIKTKPQYSPRLLENSPENPIRTVLKQSGKFSPNCAKTVPKFSLDYPKTVLKIPKNSYTQSKKLGTEFYGLSRLLRKPQAIKWPLG